MRLVDLDPRWCTEADSTAADGSVTSHAARRGMGMSFECPHCRETRLAVFFSNPVDGGPPSPTPSGKLWSRVGDTFEDMTLIPSVDASSSGHWHGFIVGGTIQ